MYEEIYLEEEGGEVFGYNVDFKSDNYKNFIASNVVDKDVLNKIIDFINFKEFYNIVIIKNLNVDAEFRGNGIGKTLLENAIEEAEIVFLISDKYESQVKGFILDKFYENQDFLKITETGTGNLMCYPSELAVDLIDYINKPKISLKIKNINN